MKKEQEDFIRSEILKLDVEELSKLRKENEELIKSQDILIKKLKEEVNTSVLETPIDKEELSNKIKELFKKER